MTPLGSYHCSNNRSHSRPVIRPITDLRNHFTRIYNALHAKDEPIILTKNGVGDIVVTSLEYYEKQMDQIELYQKLQEAEEGIDHGVIGKDARVVLGSLLRT